MPIAMRDLLTGEQRLYGQPTRARSSCTGLAGRRDADARRTVIEQARSVGDDLVEEHGARSQVPVWLGDVVGNAAALPLAGGQANADGGDAEEDSYF